MTIASWTEGDVTTGVGTTGYAALVFGLLPVGIVWAEGSTGGASYTECSTPAGSYAECTTPASTYVEKNL